VISPTVSSIPPGFFSKKPPFFSLRAGEILSRAPFDEGPKIGGSSPPHIKKSWVFSQFKTPILSLREDPRHFFKKRQKKLPQRNIFFTQTHVRNMGKSGFPSNPKGFQNPPFQKGPLKTGQGPPNRSTKPNSLLGHPLDLAQKKNL